MPEKFTYRYKAHSVFKSRHIWLVVEDLTNRGWSTGPYAAAAEVECVRPGCDQHRIWNHSDLAWQRVHGKVLDG